jgi:hypothetical protein
VVNLGQGIGSGMEAGGEPWIFILIGNWGRSNTLIGGDSFGWKGLRVEEINQRLLLSGNPPNLKSKNPTSSSEMGFIHTSKPCNLLATRLGNG